MKPSKYRPSMITFALQAAEAMRDSPIASKLKANGYTPAVMQKEAEDLTDLHTQAVAAKNAAAQATADLAKRADETAKKFASYSNLVRGLTTDPGLRRKHGVKSPGQRKSPRYHRAPHAKANAVATGASAPSTSTNGASPSNGASTNGVVTPVIGHA